jgi:hypothetical protein
MQNRSGELIITVEKQKLLSALRENLETHKKEYVDAMQEYKKRVLEGLKAAPDKFAGGALLSDCVGHLSRLPYPQNKEKEYNRAIQMLEMDNGTTVELNEHQFRCYCQDEWEWAVSAKLANSAYSVR